MIPEHIAKIMDLICPDYAQMDDDDIREVHKAAQRIWDAGYREQEPMLGVIRAARQWRESHQGYWTGGDGVLAEALDQLPTDVSP